ncbi:MAG TPA: hypothetical protein VN654_09445 [Vicinamibacterales bacterium]|jgi:hypothetical protein|nr:hypothetical protein [Vicinamibacterales bacterium]
MNTNRVQRRVACFVGAVALLIQISPAAAEDHRDHNSPVAIAFTKWVTTFPLMEGFWGGDLANKFVGEIFQRQVSVNPALNGIIRLEAIYEVQDGDRSFTALIRGGTNNVTGAAQLDGVVLAGWRTGARVHVEFDTIAGTTGCFGAPAGKTCFVGTIHVGRAPKD